MEFSIYKTFDIEISILILYIIEMVRKLKVVDVAPTQAQEAQPPQEEEIKPPQVEEVEPPQVEEVKPSHEEEIKPSQEEEAKPNEPAQSEQVVEAKPEKKKKPIEEVVCPNCNKKMLMKTYKYSHQKICKPDVHSKAKDLVVQETQAKEIKPLNSATLRSSNPPTQPAPPPPPPKQLTEKPELAVTFDAYSQLNQWNELRQQRQLVRQQRVKSLISQAI